MISDGYAQWYADRLWQLLPAVYRSLDAGATADEPGPLRELINRVGAQAAVVRRSIDRLGENQSIESCDSWAIPYLGDLLATRLVSCLDAAAQRLDVANTIYYRRRAGTVGVLEELAADIASRDARVVEFFRRLARTRHQFDPPLSYQIANPIDGPAGWTGNDLEIAENLIGAYSNTPAGGFADLRNPYAASNTGTAFDEFAYTADLRAGSQTLGHFNIRNLGVFLWWLHAYPLYASTPVSSGTTPPCFTFDPTGRDIPLFAPSQRVAEAGSWGEHWISPHEYELPVAIRQSLWQVAPEKLYPTSFSPAAFSVGLLAGGLGTPVPREQLNILPERGRFSFIGLPPIGDLAVCYNFGLLAPVGAGGFDTSLLSRLALPNRTAKLSNGDSLKLNAALKAVTADATLEITDSLTYAGPSQDLIVPNGATVTLRATDGQRPVLRWTGSEPPTWTITGQAAASGSPTVLVLEGILLQGAELVLKGAFDAVHLRMCTLDPGTSSTAQPMHFDTAIDGVPLRPTSLFIEGTVSQLVLERCIAGPIRTRFAGAIQQLTASDSIVQAIPTHLVAATGTLHNPKVYDPASLAASLKHQSNAYARTAMKSAPSLAVALKKYAPGSAPSPALFTKLVNSIAELTPAHVEAAWPLTFADLALGFSTGAVSLSRCTIMGRVHAHRLEASECIFDDVATVENPQFGCVRFTAYAAGSTLHQPYRSVQVAPRASLFESCRFGDPEYAKLRSDADAKILAAGSQASGLDCAAGGMASLPTILNGAENGSEMGVYGRENIPLKRRGLAMKFEEYSPIGQLPVWIDVN